MRNRDVLAFLVLSLVSSVLFSACSDAGWSKFSTKVSGSSARVTCHSGGMVIFDGCSTGKVSSESQSDGYYFRDARTQRLVEVSGECFIDYEAPCPTENVRPVTAAAPAR